MPDYEVWAPDDATMVAALNAMALHKTSARFGNCIFATDYYGTKYVQSGTKVITGPDGVSQITVPNMVAQAGVYCNIRWIGPTAVPALPPNSGCTIALQAAPFYRVFS